MADRQYVVTTRGLRTSTGQYLPPGSEAWIEAEGTPGTVILCTEDLGGLDEIHNVGPGAYRSAAVHGPGFRTPFPHGPMPEGIREWIDRPPHGRVEIDVIEVNGVPTHSLPELFDTAEVRDGITGERFTYTRNADSSATITWITDPAKEGI